MTLVTRPQHPPPRDALGAEIEREVSQIPPPEHRPEGRCRICQSPDSRELVNKFLAYGMKPTEIVELVEGINEKRPKNNRITYWSIYTHSKRHFNIQEPALAAYRRILERRAQQEAEEFGTGVGNLLNAYGYLEVVAQKGFENLMDSDTTVGYTAGMEAIVRLHNMTRQDSGEHRMADLRRQVGLLQQVVMEEADEATRNRIMTRLDEITGRSETMDAEVVDDDDYDDEEADPLIDVDVEDTLLD